jgi:uncharacterized membrane protein YgcG
MSNTNFNSLREGQGFRHNGKRYRRRGTRAICLDGGADLLEDFLIDFLILDILTDGELDGNFTVEDNSPAVSEPVQDNSYSGGSSYDSDSGGSSYDSGGGSDSGGGGDF